MLVSTESRQKKSIIYAPHCFPLFFDSTICWRSTVLQREGGNDALSRFMIKGKLMFLVNFFEKQATLVVGLFERKKMGAGEHFTPLYK